MTHIPLEAGDIERFTPPTLANIENPPVFRLRVGTRRDRELLSRRFIEEGQSSHSLDDIRAEMMRGMKEGWSEDDYNHWQPMITDYWAAEEDWVKENEDVAEADRQPFIFDGLTRDDLQTLSKEITAFWKPLRAMAADNYAAGETGPVILASIIIDGWQNFPVPFQREGGKISVDTSWMIKDALDDMESALGGGEVLGMAFQALALACSKRLYLPKEDEKNSSPPSTSEQTQDGLETGKGSTNGSSKVSPPSTPTPEISSETATTALSPSTTNATVE
jgi:hypothetical protein